MASPTEDACRPRSPSKIARCTLPWLSIAHSASQASRSGIPTCVPRELDRALKIVTAENQSPKSPANVCYILKLPPRLLQLLDLIRRGHRQTRHEEEKKYTIQDSNSQLSKQKRRDKDDGDKRRRGMRTIAYGNWETGTGSDGREVYRGLSEGGWRLPNLRLPNSPSLRDCARLAARGRVIASGCGPPLSCPECVLARVRHV